MKSLLNSGQIIIQIHFIRIKRQERRSMKKDIEVNTVSPTSKCVEKIITMATQNGQVSERMASYSCVMEVINSCVFMTELFHTSQRLMIRGSNTGGGKKFSFSPNRPARMWGPSSFLFDEYWDSLCRVSRDLGMKLIPHLHLVPMLSALADVSQLSVCDSVRWAENTSLLLFATL